MALRVVPCTQRQAKAYVAAHHRHHKPPQGGLFAMAAMTGDALVGVIIVDRPVARLVLVWGWMPCHSPMRPSTRCKPRWPTTGSRFLFA